MLQEHDHMQSNKTVKQRKGVQQNKDGKGLKHHNSQQRKERLQDLKVRSVREKAQKQTTASQQKVQVMNATIGEAAISGDDLFQLHCKRKNRESLLAQPFKKRAPN